MAYDVCVRMLESMGTAQTSHSGRSLLNHLKGTYRILKEWNNREEVCLAGLYHSIYGTEFFKTQTADLNQRQEIRSIIGNEAEQLAYQFCVGDRRKLILYNAKAPADKLVWVNRLTQVEEPISESSLRDLAEIEFANDIEQLDPNEEVTEDQKKWRIDFFTKGRRWVSSSAWAALSKQFNLPSGTP